MEVLALAGYFMFVISGSSLHATSIDFSVALAVFGASSCILSIVSMLLERNKLVPSIFITGTFMTWLSLSACGYAIVSPGSRLVLTGSCIFAAGKVSSAAFQMFRFNKTRQSNIAQIGLWCGSTLGFILVLISLGRIHTDTGVSLPFIYGSFAGVSGFGLVASLASIFSNYQALNSLSASLTLSSLVFVGGILSNSFTNQTVSYHYQLFISGSILYIISSGIHYMIVFYQFETDAEFRIRVEFKLKSLIDEHIRALRQASESDAGPGLFLEIIGGKRIFAAVSDGETIWIVWRLVGLCLLLSWTLLVGGIGSFDVSQLSEPQLQFAIATIILGLAFLLSHAIAVIKHSRILFVLSSVILASVLITSGILLILLNDLISGRVGPSGIFSYTGLSGVIFFSTTLWSLSKYSLTIPSFTYRTYNTLIHQLSWVPWIMLAIGVGIYNNETSTDKSLVWIEVVTLCIAFVALFVNFVGGSILIFDRVWMVITWISILSISACFYQSAKSIENGESKVGAPLIIAGAVLYLVNVLIGITHFARYCDSSKVGVESPQRPKNSTQTLLFEVFGRLYKTDESNSKTDIHGFITSEPILLWSVKISSFFCICALVIFSVSFGSVHHVSSSVTNNSGNYLFAGCAPVVILLVLLWIKSGRKSLQSIIPIVIVGAQVGAFQIINFTRYLIYKADYLGTLKCINVESLLAHLCLYQHPAAYSA
jgi:hypothetical protein